MGISGGIAAYKSAYLIRNFIKAGAEVRVVATENALEFITPVTIETLSKNKLYHKVFDTTNDYTTEHISLTDWGDVLVVAPATANIIGKFANGIADDALSTTFLAFDKKVYIAPAMNCKMYEHPILQQNIQKLKSIGVDFIEPPMGFLACGYEGKGRMEEPENIVSYIANDLQQKSILNGVKVMVSAGPTYEAIDPVRFIGNHSSGLMGFELAKNLAEKGADVTLISGPTHLKTPHSLIKRIDIVSASEMFKACMDVFPSVDIAIMSAAIADFTIENPNDSKIKKHDNYLELKLVPTQDVLGNLGKIKKENQILVGFALETDNEIENAKGKLQRKNLDFIVLNSLKDKGAGFKNTTNKITIISKNNDAIHFDLKSKAEVAQDIVQQIIKIKK